VLASLVLSDERTAIHYIVAQASRQRRPVPHYGQTRTRIEEGSARAVDPLRGLLEIRLGGLVDRYDSAGCGPQPETTSSAREPRGRAARKVWKTSGMVNATCHPPGSKGSGFSKAFAETGHGMARLGQAVIAPHPHAAGVRTRVGVVPRYASMIFNTQSESCRGGNLRLQLDGAG